MDRPKSSDQEKRAHSRLATAVGIATIALSILVCAGACDSGSNETRPAPSAASTTKSTVGTPDAAAAPAYVKDVVAYEEGTDAMFVYFVLADASGSETRAQGTVTLNVYESYMSTTTYEMRDRKLWTSSYTVPASAFQKAEVGTGSFARTRLLCSLGRIEYTRFTTKPTESYGKVEIIFRSAIGKEIRGETTYIF